MSHRKRIQLQQWLALAIAWQFIALWLSVYDHLVIHSNLARSPAAHYSFLSNWFLNSSGTFIATVLGGSFLVFYVNTKFADKSYGQALFAVMLCIIVVMSITITIAGCFYVVIVMRTPIASPDFKPALVDFILNPINIKDTLFWSTVTAITQFVFQMNNKFGPGKLWQIIVGKYRSPKYEQRIFMFVDLNASTMMAEKLGPVNYHRMLRDFFACITNPIIDHGGEIYQYVGDEIVVAWNYEQGIRNNRCIQCFFEMKKQVTDTRNYFYKTYGLVPGFKAGIHAGEVIAGEIGILKRDITYSGDVLNTTSRIRSLCREFEAELIASTDLVHALPHREQLTIRELGFVELRGREKKIQLSALENA